MGQVIFNKQEKFNEVTVFESKFFSLLEIPVGEHTEGCQSPTGREGRGSTVCINVDLRKQRQDREREVEKQTYGSLFFFYFQHLGCLKHLIIPAGERKKADDTYGGE